MQWPTTEGWLLTVGLWALAGLAAIQMARRKGRDGAAWGIGVFLFPPGLLILLFVSKKAEPNTPSDSALGTCPACNGAISNQAESCPHCGHPLKQRVVAPWYGPIVEAVGIAAVVGLIVSGIYQISTTSIFGLPSCSGSIAQNDVNRALASAPIGKVMGISVITFNSITTEQSDENIVKCHAQVTLSNDTEHRLEYSFTRQDNNQYFIKARITD